MTYTYSISLKIYAAFFHRMFRASSGSVTTFLRRSMIHSSWPLWRDPRTCASHHLRLKAQPIVWTLHIQKSHLKEFINLERNGKAAYLFVDKLHMRSPQPQEGHWNSPLFLKLHNGKQGYNKSGPEFLVTRSWHTFKYVNVVWTTVTSDASNKRCLSAWAARCHCIFLRKFFPFNFLVACFVQPFSAAASAEELLLREVLFHQLHLLRNNGIAFIAINASILCDPSEKGGKTPHRKKQGRPQN